MKTNQLIRQQHSLLVPQIRFFADYYAHLLIIFTYLLTYLFTYYDEHNYYKHISSELVFCENTKKNKENNLATDDCPVCQQCYIFALYTAVLSLVKISLYARPQLRRRR